MYFTKRIGYKGIFAATLLTLAGGGIATDAGALDRRRSDLPTIEINLDVLEALKARRYGYRTPQQQPQTRVPPRPPMAPLTHQPQEQLAWRRGLPGRPMPAPQAPAPSTQQSHTPPPPPAAPAPQQQAQPQLPPPAAAAPQQHAESETYVPVPRFKPPAESMAPPPPSLAAPIPEPAAPPPPPPPPGMETSEYAYYQPDSPRGWRESDPALPWERVTASRHQPPAAKPAAPAHKQEEKAEAPKSEKAEAPKEKKKEEEKTIDLVKLMAPKKDKDIPELPAIDEKPAAEEDTEMARPELPPPPPKAPAPPTPPPPPESAPEPESGDLPELPSLDEEETDSGDLPDLPPLPPLDEEEEAAAAPEEELAPLPALDEEPAPEIPAEEAPDPAPRVVRLDEEETEEEKKKEARERRKLAKSEPLKEPFLPAPPDRQPPPLPPSPPGDKPKSPQEEEADQVMDELDLPPLPGLAESLTDEPEFEVADTGEPDSEAAEPELKPLVEEDTSDGLPPLPKPEDGTGGTPDMRITFSATETVVPLSIEPELKQKIVEKMQEDLSKRATIVAYAEGGEEQASAARRVSLSRALAVRTFLIDNGIDNMRLSVQAKGNQNPGGPPDRVDIYLN